MNQDIWSIENVLESVSPLLLSSIVSALTSSSFFSKSGESRSRSSRIDDSTATDDATRSDKIVEDDDGDGEMDSMSV